MADCRLIGVIMLAVYSVHNLPKRGQMLSHTSVGYIVKVRIYDGFRIDSQSHVSYFVNIHVVSDEKLRLDVHQISVGD